MYNYIDHDECYQCGKLDRPERFENREGKLICGHCSQMLEGPGGYVFEEYTFQFLPMRQTMSTFTLCPKCYPNRFTPLTVSINKPGYVFCKFHGKMKWPINRNRLEEYTLTKAEKETLQWTREK
jgi:hypothetical protein